MILNFGGEQFHKIGWSLYFTAISPVNAYDVQVI